MTGALVALAVVCVASAIAVAFAVVRTRRAEDARRAAVDAYAQLAAQGPPADAARHASEEQARHTQVLEEVGRTADDLAHDLKNLLTAITGRTELLIAGLDEAHPGREDAYEIRRLALNAARIGKPLRALSGSRATTELVDVNLVTSRTAAAFREMLGTDIDVALALDPGVMRVRAGAGYVEEIVLNLAMNARDAMPQGGRLALSTARHTRHDGDASLGPAREYVRIVIAEAGEGTPESHRITPRESALVAPDLEGAGIGLARVFDVVKQSGGKISVESTPGGGTTFVVDLPAALEQTPAAAPSSARQAAASVLVVEDEPRIRELIKAVLSREGHDVVAVAGPHDGLAVLKRQPSVELLLVDVVMPDMNGYDLAAQARAVAPGLRVVFMSGFACDMTRQPPGDRFLPKPFAIEALHDIVQRALSDR